MEGRISRKKFIRLGTALGVGAASASLVACGGGSDGDSGAGETASGGSSTQAAGGNGGQETSGGGSSIAQESEVAPGSAVKFESEGEPAMLIHLEGGDFVAYSAVCTHQQCTVSYQPQENNIACPCHGSVYNPSEGAQVVNGPAPRPLPDIPIEVRGGEVFKA